MSIYTCFKKWLQKHWKAVVILRVEAQLELGRNFSWTDVSVNARRKRRDSAVKTLPEILMRLKGSKSEKKTKKEKHSKPQVLQFAWTFTHLYLFINPVCFDTQRRALTIRAAQQRNKHTAATLLHLLATDRRRTFTGEFQRQSIQTREGKTFTHWWRPKIIYLRFFFFFRGSFRKWPFHGNIHFILLLSC